MVPSVETHREKTTEMQIVNKLLEGKEGNY